MNNKEYANYDYQTTTIPFKNEYGVTIGKETKSSFKLCTKDCVYKEVIDKLRKYIRSNEWAKDYENSNTRTHLLDILKEIDKEVE